MSQALVWHKAALRASNEGKPLPSISEAEPQWGFFFKKASKAGGRVPVRIQEDAAGNLVAICGDKKDHRVEDASSVWTWVASNPVARDAYVYAWEQGKWPDGTPITAVGTTPAMGDNLPTDPFERLLAEVNDKLESARSFVADITAVQDMTRADRARNMQAEILRHKKSADAMHKAEKQPHLDASRAVDDKFRFREKLDVAAKALRTIFENIAAAEEARQRAEAQKKFEDERAAAEAERKRIEAERAKLMEDDPIAAMTSDAPELPDIPTGPEEVKVQVGGGIGRAAGLKTVWTPDIIDYEATLKHYAKHPEVRKMIDKLVASETRLHKEATDIPGVKVKPERKAA